MGKMARKYQFLNRGWQQPSLSYIPVLKSLAHASMTDRAKRETQARSSNGERVLAPWMAQPALSKRGSEKGRSLARDTNYLDGLLI